VLKILHRRNEKAKKSSPLGGHFQGNRRKTLHIFKLGRELGGRSIIFTLKKTSKSLVGEMYDVAKLRLEII